MANIALQFNRAFRDFATDGVSASGLYEPERTEIRKIGTLIEAALGSIGLGALISARFATLADANLSLAFAPGAVAIVYADPTEANNDLVVKVGASGSGSWAVTTIVHDVIGGLAGPYVEDAAVSAAEAAAAATAALAAAAAAAEDAGFAEEFSAPVYASTAAGVAATSVGQFFRVSNGDTPRTYARYERTSSSPFYVEAASLASTAQLASVSAGSGIDLVSRVPYPAASRGALKGVDTARYQVAHLLEAGRWGLFLWTTGDFTARVAADPREAVFIKATAVAASVGAWVRQYDELRPEMFGVVDDGNDLGGGTDNADAIQSIFNLLDHLTNRTVRFTGKYSASSTTSRIGGGLTRTLECWSDKVRLRGPGTIVGKNTTASENNWRFILFGGAGKIAGGTGDITTQRCIDKAGVAITGPIAEGARTVPVTAGAEAGFAAGDVVFIRTGQLLSSGLTEPKSEVAIVASTSSGSILLDRPTTHDYAQEYFISGTSGLTSTSVTANPARYEIVKVTDRVQRDLRIEDGLKFRQAGLAGTGLLSYANLAGFPATGEVGKTYFARDTYKYYRWDGLAYVEFAPFTQCLSMWGILGVNLDCTLEEYPCAGMGWRDSSEAVVNLRLQHNGVVNNVYGFHPSTGCSRLSGIVRQTSAGFNTVQFHESVGDVEMTIISSNVGGVGEVYGGLNIANRARNIRLDARIDVGVSAQNAVQNIDGTDMKNVVIEARTNGNVRDDSGQIVILNRGVGGRVSMRGAQLSNPLGSRGEFVVLSGWVTAAKKTCILGTVPHEAIVMQAGTSVSTAISGGTSTRVDAGYVDGTGKEIVNGAICSTTGTGRTLDANQTANGAGPGMALQTGLSRTVQASFADNTATAGSVLVYVVYFIAARRD